MCLTAKIGYRHTASLARSKGASKALPTDGRLASKTDRPELLLEYTDAMSSSRLLQRVPSSSAPVPSPAISHTALLGVEPEAARQVRVIVQQSAERPLHPLDRQQFPAGVIGKRLRFGVRRRRQVQQRHWPPAMAKRIKLVVPSSSVHSYSPRSFQTRHKTTHRLFHPEISTVRRITAARPVHLIEIYSGHNSKTISYTL